MSNRLSDPSNGTGDCLSEDQSREWAIAKLLLDANAHTTRALEEHLLRNFIRTDSNDYTMLRQSLENSIQTHTEIVENLETTLAVVEANESTETQSVRTLQN